MAPSLEISIPSTSTSQTPKEKPYTIYAITLRQPLRSWTLSKRYSDFLTLHTTLLSQVHPQGTPPPQPLPRKSWFQSTVSSAKLTEERRRGLEVYLRAVNEDQDDRWRSTAAWRGFLNLPNTTGAGAGAGAAGKGGKGLAKGSAVAAAVEIAARSADLQAAITDPVVWLDVHREVKSVLRDARAALTRREQVGTASLQHEAGAEAKRALVRSGTLVAALERGLAAISASGGGSGKNETKQGAAAGGNGGRETSLGDGEIRRRKDLLGALKKERDSLDSLLNNFSQSQGPAGNETVVAATGDRQDLFKSSGNTNGNGNITNKPTSRRVLGAKETDKTRELDNTGVLQLQKQIMQEQDEDVGDLTKVVRRMKDIGVHINEELVVQNEMLGMLDQDVDRVGGKIEVAKKRVGKIR